MLIRSARIEDARGVAEVHLRGWQIGHRDFFPAEFLNNLEQWRGESGVRRREQALSDPALTHLVAEEDGRIVGFAGFGLNGDGLGDTIGELHGLYVDPDYWDRGIGTALIEAAEASLKDQGFPSAILWTLAVNERTRRFYEHRGWHFDGTTLFHEASKSERVRYVKQLNALPKAG